ncbi:hypothetical protein B0H11DRAFT_1913950 [Mycena galericulata]|nr:hypothetical protein B0H11DRAFT_1913950 [Mycena galericulata]
MSSLHKMQQLTSDEVVVGIGPSIGSDVLDVDYSATRDQTILEFDGSWNRYTFKILRRPWTTPDVLPFSLRSQTRGRYWTGATGQRYLTNIIGRVRWHRDLYQHNPLLREGRGEMCFELHVKKLQNVNKATSDFYDAQLENLRYIISKDDKRRPGDVDRHWVQPNDSDTLRAPQPVIEITSDGRYRELRALIGDNSRDLLMQVFLVVDTCLFSDGKIFRMWINDYRELTDKELGRGGRDEGWAQIFLVALLRGRPSIGRDTPGLDYHATRDRTIHRSNQVWSRYSYEAHARKPTSHLALKHIRHAREPKNVYNGQLIGQVNRWGFYYEDAPLSLVDIGRACLVYELKCPDGADQETVHIFACQVANLQRIIQEDSITKPGTVVRDWFTDDEGPPFIKVVACGAEAGWDADLGNGGDVRMTVSMTRDIHENGNGMKKIFTIWLHRFVPLSSRSIGQATLKEFTAFEALKNVDSLIDDRYREDYLPTRDRSVWYGEQQGSRYSYKRSSALVAAKADPLRTEGLRRSNSKPYRPWIIGAVAEIAATEQSSDRTVTLKCVADDHPVARHLFQSHCTALQNIVAAENTGAALGAATSWVVPASDQGGLPMIKVVISKEFATGLVIGQPACFFVSMTRDDIPGQGTAMTRGYRLWAETMKTLGGHAHTCGVAVSLPPSAFMYTELPNISVHPWASPPLGSARLGTDFVATRDCTGPAGEDVFSFKSQTAGFRTSRFFRNALWMYTPTLIGEVFFMGEKRSPFDKTYQVLLRCPANASARVRTVYRDQAGSLTDTMSRESVALKKTVETLWVSGQDEEAVITLNFPAGFMTPDLEVGVCVSANVWMYRRRMKTGTLVYSLTVEDYVVTDPLTLHACL